LTAPAFDPPPRATLPPAASWLTMRRRGQSWGKQVARIRVVAIDGGPVSAGTVIVRDVVGKFAIFTMLAVIALFVPTIVNFLWPLFDFRNQALHDKMAQTLVVSSEPAGPRA
jgi:uncharacterized RDD family membrane protein YckC